jgi:putative hydrolases of HD superfamily
MSAAERLAGQLAFLVEIDRLKQVERMTLITGASRRENTAEHSWHLALLAMVLAEHANQPVDVAHVVRMLLVHDIVEVDAGDTFAYDTAGNATKVAREQAAADRLYGLLPADQHAELRALWDEFESGETAEARFARAVDRLQPVLLNHHAGTVFGVGPWFDHGVSPARVLERNAPVAQGSSVLWDVVQACVAELDDAGLFEQAGTAQGSQRRKREVVS